MKVGVLRFLGTNCDFDVAQAISTAGGTPEFLWWQDRFDIKNYGALVLPGGFSYGDYLRCGALAAKAPAMKDVVAAAEHGMPILGICNGFQILCEAGLLPGVLLRNQIGRFIDRWVELNLENSHTFFTAPKACRIPIAHGDGRFFAPEEELKKIKDNGQVWLTYRENPNGSLENIAGLMNKQKNVAALMPHPERAMFDWMGSTAGAPFFAKVCQ